MSQRFPIEISPYCTLKQAKEWIAFSLPPTTKIYEEYSKYSKK